MRKLKLLSQTKTHKLHERTLLGYKVRLISVIATGEVYFYASDYIKFISVTKQELLLSDPYVMEVCRAKKPFHIVRAKIDQYLKNNFHPLRVRA